MNCPEETRQQLWDLIYGLLPPEEADSLCARISAEPQVARAYAEAKLRADLVAAAARLQEARLPLGDPGEPRDASHKVCPPRPAAANTAPDRARSAARIVSILASLAALVLVAHAGFGYSRYGSAWATAALKAQREELAQQFVRIVVAGPQVVEPTATNSFSLKTVDIDGTPISTDVRASVLANGVSQFDRNGRTDDNGVWNFEVSGHLLDNRATLRFEAEDAVASAPLQAELNSLAMGYGTLSVTDGRKWYLASGEVDARQPVELDVRSAGSSNLVVMAENGGRQVGQKAIALPPDEAGVRSNVPTHFFLDLPRDVAGPTRVTLYDYDVNPPSPLWKQYFYVSPLNKIKVDRTDPVDVYTPGEEVQLQFQVSAKGQPIPAELSVAVIDESVLLKHDPIAWTDFQSDANNTNKAKETEDRSLEEILVLSDDYAPSLPPMVLDNSSVVHSAYQQAVAQLDRGREAKLWLLGQVTLAGGVVLLAGLAAVAFLRLSGPRVLIPTLAAAALCILVGALWMTARVDERGEVALAPFASAKDKSTRREDTLDENNLRSLKPGLPIQSSASEQAQAGDYSAQYEPADSPATAATKDPAARFARPSDNDLDSSKYEGKLGQRGEGGFSQSAGAQPVSGAGGTLDDGKRSGKLGLSQSSPGEMPLSSLYGIPGLGGESEAFGRQSWRFIEQQKQAEAAIPTMYSNSQLTTGEDGRATVSFKLPPTPGARYRVFVEGRSGESLGRNSWKISARQAAAAAARQAEPANEAK